MLSSELDAKDEIEKILTKYQGLLKKGIVSPDDILAAIDRILKNDLFSEEISRVNYSLVKQLDKTIKMCFDSGEISFDDSIRNKIYAFGWVNECSYKSCLAGCLAREKSGIAVSECMSKSYGGLKRYSQNIELASEQKIPRIIHQVWISKTKEIKKEEVDYIIEARNIFLNSSYAWEHVIWTNDKKLILSFEKMLISHGIQVKEISEVLSSEVLRNFKDIEELVEEGLGIVASEIVRYALLNQIGGVYADLNFKFNDNAPERLENVIYRYDFYMPNYRENYSFCSRKNHPVLIATLDMIDQKFNDPLACDVMYYFHCTSPLPFNKKGQFDKGRMAKYYGIKMVADEFTWEPFIRASLVVADINGNIDGYNFNDFGNDRKDHSSISF